jgi:hypothetical protein
MRMILQFNEETGTVFIAGILWDNGLQVFSSSNFITVKKLQNTMEILRITRRKYTKQMLEL